MTLPQWSYRKNNDKSLKGLVYSYFDEKLNYAITRKGEYTHPVTIKRYWESKKIRPVQRWYIEIYKDYLSIYFLN
jgi:hypothetical protein